MYQPRSDLHGAEEDCRDFWRGQARGYPLGGKVGIDDCTVHLRSGIVMGLMLPHMSHINNEGSRFLRVTEDSIQR